MGDGPVRREEARAGTAWHTDRRSNSRSFCGKAERFPLVRFLLVFAACQAPFESGVPARSSAWPSPPRAARTQRTMRTRTTAPAPCRAVRQPLVPPMPTRALRRADNAWLEAVRNRVRTRDSANSTAAPTAIPRAQPAAWIHSSPPATRARRFRSPPRTMINRVKGIPIASLSVKAAAATAVAPARTLPSTWRIARNGSPTCKSRRPTGRGSCAIARLPLVSAASTGSVCHSGRACHDAYSMPYSCSLA